MVNVAPRSAVISARVAEECWRHHGVVKRGVEGATLLLRAAFHLDALQFLVPLRFSFVRHCLKVPIGILRLKRRFRSFYTHRRKCYFEHHFFVRLGRKVQARIKAVAPVVGE